MNRNEAVDEFNEVLGDSGNSVEVAINAIENQLKWFQYVPSSDLTKAENRDVIGACRKLYVTLRKLNAKYND